MATEIVLDADATGAGTYDGPNAIQDWIDAITPIDITGVAGGYHVTLQSTDGVAFNPFTVADFTTDITHPLVFESLLAQRHVGAWDDTRVRVVGEQLDPVSSVAGDCIGVDDDNVHFIGLLVKYEGASYASASPLYAYNAISGLFVDRCILTKDSAITGHGVDARNASNGSVSANTVRNTYIYGVNEGVFVKGGADSWLCENLTITDVVTACFDSDTSGAIKCTNCVTQHTQYEYYQCSAASDYNIAENEAAPGGNSQAATTLIFTNPASGDCHLNNSTTSPVNAVVEGTALSLPTTYTNDIDGGERVDWDLGADEIDVGKPVILPAISYTTPQVLTELTLASISATNTGDPADTWESVPSLPDALTFDASGNIAGVPTTPQGATVHEITATNDGGFDTFDLTITVEAKVIPSYRIRGNGPGSMGSHTTIIQIDLLDLPSISYNTPNSWPDDVAITPISPTNSGGVSIDWTIPGTALPTGLVIDPTTGIISGTPTTPAASAPYTVRATNATGYDDFDITITIATETGIFTPGWFADGLWAKDYWFGLDTEASATSESLRPVAVFGPIPSEVTALGYAPLDLSGSGQQ